MGKNKRKADVKNAVEEKIANAKKSRGKRLRTGVTTLTVCAAAFGAYYSPHFRAISSDWLNRWREIGTEEARAEKNGGTATDEPLETLTQAPSFRDFLTDEYGEEGARELLGLAAEPTAPFSSIPESGPGFADYVAAESPESSLESPESTFSKVVEPQELATSDDSADAASFSASPTAPGPGSSFADYVAAESLESSLESPEPTFSEVVEPQEFATSADSVDAASFSASPTAPGPGSSFADYVAAESDDNFETEETTANVEKTRLASAVEPAATAGLNENETALAARLQDEMKERGVGAPRIERWGGRFWRASGFATTSEGVATFCEAVDVDPTSAQRAALAKFKAATF